MNKDKIIKSSKTYSEIISKKQTYKNNYFSLYYQQSEKTLFGITVPKKVGKAHIRNKLKRQIKNIISNNEKNIQNKTSYVIIVKETALDLTYLEKETKLIELFKKVRD